MTAHQPRDRAYDAHQAAVTHIERLENFQEECEQTGDYNQDGPESAGPWCACETCQVREALAAAWPHALAYAADLIDAWMSSGDAAAKLRHEAKRLTLAGLDVPA